MPETDLNLLFTLDAVLAEGSVVGAARRLGLPIVIHEQNVLPGLANKLAARLTSHVYTSFPQTELPHAHCIGLPMRRGITDLDRVALQREARISFELHPELPTLLVSGGSQGALRINTAVAGAWPELLAQGIQVLHVLGPKNLAAGIVRSLDEQTGAVYQPLAYVEQMERAYAAADLMLGRGGAMTCAEVAAIGLPTVYVPYPHSNQEQKRNALPVVEAGGGLLVDDAEVTPAWVERTVIPLIRDPQRLAAMGTAAAAYGRRDGDVGLLNFVYEAVTR